MPCCCQRYIILGLLFGLRRDPFDRFIALTCLSCPRDFGLPCV
jgi:hypothetical protein